MPETLDPLNSGLNPLTTPPTVDNSVATKVGEITSQNSDLMKQAKTAGLQTAAKRGLANSSLAGQASQEAVLKAAVPIASQDSQQAYGKDLAAMNIAANNRDKVATMLAQAQSTYANMFSQIGANENLPAAVRDKYLSHIGLLRDSDYNVIEQIYNVDLDWGSPTL